jgi:hypothetical protein
MSTGIVLPALNVNAVAPAFSISTLGFVPPNPAVAMSAMHPLRLRKYAEGYWREMMIKHMEEVNRRLKIGWRYSPTFELLTDMLKIPLADKYMCLNPHALSTDAVREAISGWGYRKTIADARELSGGVLTPFAAWSHYIDGSGADVKTDLNRLGLNLSVTKIPALESAFANAIVGSSPVHLAKVPYNTRQDSWITWTWLGHITLKIEGVVNKGHDGRISFSGVARAYNDTYDFNASTHRSELGEAATAGGLYLGGTKGKPYQIIIQGELPISIQR